MLQASSQHSLLYTPRAFHDSASNTMVSKDQEIHHHAQLSPVLFFMLTLIWLIYGRRLKGDTLTLYLQFINKQYITQWHLSMWGYMINSLLESSQLQPDSGVCVWHACHDVMFYYPCLIVYQWKNAKIKAHRLSSPSKNMNSNLSTADMQRPSLWHFY